MFVTFKFTWNILEENTQVTLYELINIQMTNIVVPVKVLLPSDQVQLMLSVSSVHDVMLYNVSKWLIMTYNGAKCSELPRQAIVTTDIV